MIKVLEVVVGIELKDEHQAVFFNRFNRSCMEDNNIYDALTSESVVDNIDIDVDKTRVILVDYQNGLSDERIQQAMDFVTMMIKIEVEKGMPVEEED